MRSSPTANFSLSLLLLSSLLSLAPSATSLSLTTTTTVKNVDVKTLHAFISTPSNWPRIVASSWSVEGAGTDKPLSKGKLVDEVFGLPPVVPLRVRWTCASSKCSGKTGTLDVRSDSGLEGVASDARMQFKVTEALGPTEGCEVELVMSYAPSSPLAVLAQPVLALDNALALKVLLPLALKAAVAGGNEEGGSAAAPLDEFRSLMGGLYGVAGLAHAADIASGTNALFASSGIPPFSSLPPPGQALAAAWCLAGPAAFWCTRQNSPSLADIGIAAYGAVEVLGAAVAVGTGNGDGSALVSALAVQLVVAASWKYSDTRGKEV